MHLLQWMHSDDDARPVPHAVGEVGLAQEGAGHGDEREALGQRRLDGGAVR